MKYEKEVTSLLNSKKDIELFKAEFEKIKGSLSDAEFEIFFSEYSDAQKIEMDKLDIQFDSLMGECKEFLIKEELKEVEPLLNYSYIAKKYFNKSRQWIYQRINNTKVNGKPAKFTEDELKTFEFALKDISKITGSISFF